VPESIEELKIRLRQTYLGKAGIHGIGLSRVEQALRVYVGPEAQSGQEEVLAQLRKSAEPFAVQVIQEEPPILAGGVKQAAPAGPPKAGTFS
jgi:hypothetical protein